MSNGKKRSSILMRSIGTQTPRSNSVDMLNTNSLNCRNEFNNDMTLENSKVIINSFSQSQLTKSEMHNNFPSSRMKYKKIKMNSLLYNRSKDEIKNNVNVVNDKLKSIKDNQINIYTHQTPNNNYLSKFKYQKYQKFDFNQSIIQHLLSLRRNYFNNNTYHRKSSLSHIKIITNNKYNRMNGNHSLNDLSLNKNYSLRNTKYNLENNQSSFQFPLLEINTVVKPRHIFQNPKLKLLRKSNKHLYNLSFFKPPKYVNDNSKHFICKNKLSHNKVKLSLSNNSSVKNYNSNNNNNNIHI